MTAKLDDLRLRDALDAIAAKTPTPGGGAVASIVAALAAALAQMVVNYSTGKKNLAAHDELHLRSLAKLHEFRQHAIDLADLDAQAYSRLNVLMKLQVNDDRRTRELPDAVLNATNVPRNLLRLSVELLRLLHELCGKTNSLLNSDLAIAAILAQATARAASWNIMSNLSLVKDPQFAQEVGAELAIYLEAAGELPEQIEEMCHPK